MKRTVHSLIYALSNILSNILLQVDAGDIDYKDHVEVTLEEGKLKVREGFATIIDTDLG